MIQLLHKLWHFSFFFLSWNANMFSIFQYVSLRWLNRGSPRVKFALTLALSSETLDKHQKPRMQFGTRQPQVTAYCSYIICRALQLLHFFYSFIIIILFICYTIVHIPYIRIKIGANTHIIPYISLKHSNLKKKWISCISVK